MRLDLSDEERRALLLFVHAALVEPKYPFSPEVEALRRAAEKLRANEKRKAVR